MFSAGLFRVDRPVQTLIRIVDADRALLS